MSAKVFAEWLRRQGYRVIRTPSSYWYEVSRRVYQAFPYHWIIEPEEKELRQLLVQNRAIALRYSTRVNAPQGKLSYHVVCQDPAYDVTALPRQGRQNIRKGLKYADVEPISMARLADEGWGLRAETLARQERTDAESEGWWRRLCLSAQDLPGFEAWGAVHDGQLVAAFLAFACDSCYHLPYFQSATAHLKHRVANGLFYTVTRQALARPGISSVFAGLQSLDAPPSVDEFKFRIGYTAQPVRQRVVFHPWLSPAFNPSSHALVKRLLNRYPERPALAKTEGMIRFYLEGKRPLEKQHWPENLALRKGELLEV